jgi:hypothetical protein
MQTYGQTNKGKLTDAFLQHLIANVPENGRDEAAVILTLLPGIYTSWKD